MNAWLFQDYRQKQKLGDDAPWSVGWIDPDGKRRSKRIGSHSAAEKYRRKIEGQLAAGLYRNESAKTWEEFVGEYRTKVINPMPATSRRCVELALKNFAEAVKPVKLSAIKTRTIDDFIAKRRKAIGRKSQSLSPATINRDLRHLKAAFRVAHDWGYLNSVPKVRLVREQEKLPRFVTDEHFEEIYKACDLAKYPQGLPYSAADWWRGLLTFAYMTGWRISECLALRRTDVDVDAAVAITRAADNKGRRDAKVPLNPIVVEHLRRLASFHLVIFPWPYHERTLWAEFSRIQKAAGIKLPCEVEHDHTDACHHYGFHDFRRAFATQNAPALSADALQKLMRHKSYLTTQRYINMASQLDAAVEVLHVPAVLKGKKA